MRVKDLKELMEGLDDDAEVLITDYKGVKAASGYRSHAVLLRRMPEAHEVPKSVMAMSDVREFALVSIESTFTPDYLKKHAVPVLVIDT
jgi:hypothetical protein